MTFLLTRRYVSFYVIPHCFLIVFIIFMFCFGSLNFTQQFIFIFYTSRFSPRQSFALCYFQILTKFYTTIYLHFYAHVDLALGNLSRCVTFSFLVSFCFYLITTIVTTVAPFSFKYLCFILSILLIPQ